MAENAASFAIQTIGTLLKEKIVFLQGVEEQVRNLQDELLRIRCFLKDADQKQDEDELIRNWVSEMRALSYDAEDAIEIFVTKMEYIKNKPLFKRFAYLPVKLYCLNKVGEEIESIQSRISAIEASRVRYGIRELGEGTNARAEELQNLRRTAAYSEDKNIVGIEDKAASIVSQLLGGDGGRRVFSITGMGGIGKTTLVRKIYNDVRVQSAFSLRAWICVSERYNLRGIVKAIIKQVNSVSIELLEKLEKMEDRDLEQMLHECLKGHRYLVVLDDIWKEEVWNFLSKVLPDENKGNRLLVTSRNKTVAQNADHVQSPYELGTLEEEESWLLFAKNAFADSPYGRCPSLLEGVGRKIVSKCGGLPLAIEIIGSLLLRKKSLSDWERVEKDISQHLSEARSGVSSILELSYRDLSPNLKFCFNYLGFFPEDHEISVQKLIHMWVAEGIVLQSDDIGGKSLEEIAVDYMEQLINRNMVKAAEITLDNRVKTCRLHDLLRDLAIRKAKDENFLQILAGMRSTDDEKLSEKCRYLAVHSQADQENLTSSAGYSTPHHHHLRTLLFFNMGRYLALDGFRFRGILLLGVLHLEDTKIDRLPKEIKAISLLRYLGLRGTDIKELPSSLGRLQHLQTLDLFNRPQVQIPNVIWKLERLRHLYLNNHSPNAPLKIEGLKSLKTLSRVHYDNLIGNNHLNTLTSLEKLGIWIESNSDIDKLGESLSQLRNLRSLNLYAGTGFPPMAGISDVISNLSKLKLFGQLHKLPDLPPNLSHLSLRSTYLEHDPMPILAKLGSLSFLKLDYAYTGNKLTISKNGFYQLNFLELRDLNCLQEVVIEEAALQELRCLRIRGCISLKMLPVELASMTSLKKLEIVNMPKKFVSELDEASRLPSTSMRIFEQLNRPPFDVYRGSSGRDREH